MSDDATAPNLYASPTGVVGTAPPLARARRRRKRALVLFVASVALFFASLLTFVLTIAVWPNVSPGAITVGCALATSLAALGFVSGVASALASLGGEVFFGFSYSVGLSMLVNVGMALLGAQYTYWSTLVFSRGRQLRSLGRVLLPRIRASGEWAGLELAVPVDDARLRAALAQQWRENGRTEHASVAAFARLTLDLMALGAPPALVASANRDALDEIRHTELCFSLARGIDGESQSPGPFPEARAARTLVGRGPIALAQLAVDSLVDGALHEGVSARVVAKLAKRCEVPAIRAVLKEIAADEGRHAAHGWDVVEWCLRGGGTAVANALAGAFSALPTEMRTPRPDAAAAGTWERYGIVGSRLEAEEFARTRADLIRRVEALIRARPAAAA
jgi:hypothetical protein